MMIIPYFFDNHNTKRKKAGALRAPASLIELYCFPSSRFSSFHATNPVMAWHRPNTK